MPACFLVDSVFLCVFFYFLYFFNFLGSFTLSTSKIHNFCAHVEKLSLKRLKTLKKGWKTLFGNCHWWISPRRPVFDQFQGCLLFIIPAYFLWCFTVLLHSRHCTIVLKCNPRTRSFSTFWKSIILIFFSVFLIFQIRYRLCITRCVYISYDRIIIETGKKRAAGNKTVARINLFE